MGGEMKTPEEARETICPKIEAAIMARFGYVPEGADNASCIADRCMAWRWEYGYSVYDAPHKDKKLDRGWCGIAGKPEA
jgi:hypothetical protein